MENNLIDWLLNEMKKLNIKVSHSDAIPLMELLEKAKVMYENDLSDCWETAHQVGRFEAKEIAEKNWITFEDFCKEISR